MDELDDTESPGTGKAGGGVFAPRPINGHCARLEPPPVRRPAKQQVEAGDVKAAARAKLLAEGAQREAEQRAEAEAASQAQSEGDAWMREVFGGSGLRPDDMGPGTTYVVGTTGRPHWPEDTYKLDDEPKPLKRSIAGLVQGYVRFPILDINGDQRRDAIKESPIWKIAPHFSAEADAKIKKDHKYLGPIKDVVERLGYKGGNLPIFPPRWAEHFDPDNPILYIPEGDKKTVCGQHRLTDGAVLGIPGCKAWGNGDSPPEPHNDILAALDHLKRLVREHRQLLKDTHEYHAFGPRIKIVIIPDGDYKRADIGRSFDRFARCLAKLNCEVVVWSLEGFESIVKLPKLDDVLIALDFDMEKFRAGVKEVPANLLPDDPVVMAQELKLITLTSPKNRVGYPEANLSNLMKVLEGHRRFRLEDGDGPSVFSFNLDTGQPQMYGVDMDSDDMRIYVTNVLQEQLGFADC